MDNPKQDSNDPAPLQAGGDKEILDFLQHIEELTGDFKGRESERGLMLDFVRGSDKGFLSVQGNPGIGKSALVAQFYNDLSKEGLKGLIAIPYFIRRGTSQSQAEQMLQYLLRRTDEVFPEGRDVEAEGMGLWELQNRLNAKWRLWPEHSNGRKLLILIDGLDEGVEGGVFSHLPREDFEGILFIYGSRSDGHPLIRDLWNALPAVSHRSILLKGLGREDIQAMVGKVAGKYDIGRESVWIDRVAQRSEGNPLYLKLLCDAIEHGRIGISDMDTLPSEIHGYYDAILQRYAGDRQDGRELLRGLYVFAAAKDYLTFRLLGAVNDVDEATLNRIASTLREVLQEDQLSTEERGYRLFHESFREHLRKERLLYVEEAGERIIDFCATWPRLKEGRERRYALEHYAEHLFESKKEERVGELMALMRDAAYMAEQKRYLLDFRASNRLCRMALLKASERNLKRDLLEAALGLVDLKYEEANDAPKVVELVKRGEMDHALRRIEALRDDHRDGMRRKFILYMLCLMELTLLSGKGKPFRRSSIEKLLKHFDEQLPMDYGLLDWWFFFPSHLAISMAFECADLGLDYIVIFRRTKRWRDKWISAKGPYSDLQFDVLRVCAHGMKDKSEGSGALVKISGAMARQGRLADSDSVMQEALSLAKSLGSGYQEGGALKPVVVELSRQGRMEEALACARDIGHVHWKCLALVDISAELARRGRAEEAGSVLQEALACARGTYDENWTAFSLQAVSFELENQGRKEESASVMGEAMDSARSIGMVFWRSVVSRGLAIELANHGKLDEAIDFTRRFVDGSPRNLALVRFTELLAREGRVEEARACALEITNEGWISSAQSSIYNELLRQGRVEEVIVQAKAMGKANWNDDLLGVGIIEAVRQGRLEQALVQVQGMGSEDSRSDILKSISTELLEQGRLDEALACVRDMVDGHSKNEALQKVSEGMADHGRMDQASIVMQEFLASVRGMESDFVKTRSLSEICDELLDRGRAEQALACARSMSDPARRVADLLSVSGDYAGRGRMEDAASVMTEALACARDVRGHENRVAALLSFSRELARQRMPEEAASVVGEALDCARSMDPDGSKSEALEDISVQLADLGRHQDAESVLLECLESSRLLPIVFHRCIALSSIAQRLHEWGRSEEASSVMLEAIACARGMREDVIKCLALLHVSSRFSSLGSREEAESLLEESLACARGLDDEGFMGEALNHISKRLARLGRMDEALFHARGIECEYERSLALKAISLEMAKKGLWSEAGRTVLEIPRTAERQACWQEIAAKTASQVGWESAMQEQAHLHSQEARMFHHRGWIDEVGIGEADSVFLQKAAPLFADDPKSLETALQKYVLHGLFLGDGDRGDSERLVRCLNIQWALEVVEQFPT